MYEISYQLSVISYQFKQLKHKTVGIFRFLFLLTYFAYQPVVGKAQPPIDTLPPCTVCAKPLSCPLLDTLGKVLNKKTDLGKFCTSTLTDEQLLQVLLVMDSWSIDSVKKSFITSFATIDSFKQTITANPNLVGAWAFYQTTNRNRLTFVQVLMTNYPNILNKFTAFAHDTIRNRFITTFNGNTYALSRLSSDIPLIDTWSSLKHLTSKGDSIGFLSWLRRINGSESQFVRLRRHLFVGDPTYIGSTIHRVKGVHHKLAITYSGTGVPVAGQIRLKDTATAVGGNGVYEQKVEIYTGSIWNPKIGPDGKATFFPNLWSKEQVLEEIAWARTRLTVANWISQSPAPSNTYRIAMTTGDLIDFYIGFLLNAPPTALTDNIISSFPKR